MHAVSPRGSKLLPTEVDIHLLDDARPANASATARTTRQDYLDALPIAAAILAERPDGTICIDHANQAFCRLIGVASADLSKPITGLDFMRRSGISATVADFMSGSEKHSQFEGHDGQLVSCRHFTVRLGWLRPTLQSKRKRCLLSLIDRTAQVETEQNLRSEMLRDSLSGLPNRVAFIEQIEAILDSDDFEEGHYAVLKVDMTRFSRVNECVGATAGDELLITFARRLLSALRPSDVLARTGGDEFAILMRLTSGIDDALAVADRIRSVLSAPFRLSELEIRVDCAIGCAMVTRAAAVADEALRNAQFALKRAKRSGKTEIYEPIQAQTARHRFTIETELRRAIEKEELRLAFQPLVDLTTGAVAGFEALARWRHEERGEISPTEFIPVAEESGLIVSLGRWALDAAARTLAEWDAKAGGPLPLYVGVNLSAIQISRDDVAAVVEAALRRHGIGGKRLMLELTESAIIQDPDRATEVLEALKALDASVAMDDFGTGYTSLASLQRLPIDVLKIDRSFVTGMMDDRDSTAIIRAVLSVANALGLQTTAEGIESAELARTLGALGCSHGQGYFFSEPLEADVALAYWLARRT